MFKRKRKHDETLPIKLMWFAFNSAQRILLIIGLVTVILVAILVLVLEPFFSKPNNPSANILVPPRYTSTVIPIQPLDADMQLVLVTAGQQVFTNIDTNAGLFHATDVIADTVVYSPNRRYSAWLGYGLLRLETPGDGGIVLKFAGNVIMPTWNADSDTLMFVVHDADNDVLYRLRTDNATAVTPILIVRKLLAPPLFHPATGRVLIAQLTEGDQTSLETIDPNCMAQQSCLASRRPIATIPYLINWATFHPNGTALIVSSLGTLYQVTTATGSVTPFLNSGRNLYHPVFNRKGTALAYLSEGTAYVMRLSDSVTIPLSLSNVLDVEWAD